MATKQLKPVSSKKSWLSNKALFLILILFILINLGTGSFFSKLRFDLTEDKIFTLSDSTKQILKNLDKAITIKVFYSKKLTVEGYPFLNSYYSRVKDFLDQYQGYSDNLNIEFIDPEPFSEAEDDAVDYNLQGIPVDQDGNDIYFGIVGIADQKSPEVIPFLSQEREAYLEYDITKVIQSLSSNINKKVGVISSLPITGDFNLYSEPHPWMIWEQLKQSFDVALLDPDLDSIDKDVDVLMLIKPDNLSENSLYAIDQFVMRGGKVIALASSRDNVSLPSEETPKFSFNNLLNSWGVGIVKDKYVSVPKASKLIAYNKNGKEYISPYPLWIDLDSSYFSNDDVITSNLNKLTLVNASAIITKDKHTTKITPIIRSGVNSSLIDVDSVDTYKQNPELLTEDIKVDPNDYNLAVRISGPVSSAFNKQFKNDSQYKGFTNQSNIILISSPDMVRDEMWVQVQDVFGSEVAVPTSGNGGFILSAIDNLLGSNSLISMRNRGIYARPFTKIAEIEMDSRKKYQAKEQELLLVLEDTKSRLAKFSQQPKETNLDPDLSVSNTNDLLDSDLNSNTTGEKIVDNKISTPTIAEIAEREKFKSKLLSTRKDLREVRLALKNDIDLLQFKIKFINIVLIPLLLTLLGCGLWFWSTRSRKSHID